MSLPNLERMIAERGICLDHSAIHRWVIRYTLILPVEFQVRKRSVTSKWHDEPILKRLSRFIVQSHKMTVGAMQMADMQVRA